jgi:quercetin 2,3-dioxygenase
MSSMERWNIGRDSLGTGSIIRPGEVQRMSAGTGVTHSEFNHSRRESVHFLQIWILPELTGLPPSYEQRAFSDKEKRGNLRLVASRDGWNGSVTIHQDVDLYAVLLDAGARVSHQLTPGQHAWVQVARGAVTLNNQVLIAGDGAAISDEIHLVIQGTEAAEVLLFDLP